MGLGAIECFGGEAIGLGLIAQFLDGLGAGVLEDVVQPLHTTCVAFCWRGWVVFWWFAGRIFVVGVGIGRHGDAKVRRLEGERFFDPQAATIWLGLVWVA